MISNLILQNLPEKEIGVFQTLVFASKSRTFGLQSLGAEVRLGCSVDVCKWYQTITVASWG